MIKLTNAKSRKRAREDGKQTTVFKQQNDKFARAQERNFIKNMSLNISHALIKKLLVSVYNKSDSSHLKEYYYLKL